jgi:kynurenine formamidase
MNREERLIDLTKPMDGRLAIYSEDGYSDPPFSIQTWTTVAEQAYWVSRVNLGTQTGTHIDAPAHFDASGAMLDALSVTELVGRYFLLSCADEELDLVTRARAYAGEIFLFLNHNDEIRLSQEEMDHLCALTARVWVIGAGVQVVGQDPLYFHRRLAAEGKFLIEDLDPDAAARVRCAGELYALPLNLQAVSGAPCRVVALPDADSTRCGGAGIGGAAGTR